MAARKRKDNAARLGAIPDALGWKYGFDGEQFHNKPRQPIALKKVVKGKEVLEPFTYRPIMITMELVDLETQEEYWHISWYKKDGSVQSVPIERELAKSATKLGKLDAFGLPSKPSKLPKLVEFLADVEASAEIETGYVTEYFGWQLGVDKVDRWFLWGETALASSTQKPPQLFPVSKHSPQQMDEFTFACHAKGSFEGWKDAVGVIEPFPGPVAALVSALASPMLRVFHASPFILDLAYKTSFGKTISLAVAGSVVGQPNHKDQRGSTVQTMDSASTVGFEVISEILGSLPVLVDDSKTAKSRDLIEKFIYQQATGRGRLRGTPEGGVRATHKWLNACVTTGEAPLKSHSEAGGAAVRVLSWEDAPFGDDKETTGLLVTQLHDDVMANYGHALPALVQYTLDRQDDWEGWRDELVREEKRLVALLTDNSGTVRRQSESMAVLVLTGRIAFEAGVLTFDPADVLDEFWETISEGSRKDLDKPAKAMNALRSWIEDNPHRIFDNRDQSVVGPIDKVREGAHVKYDGSAVRNVQQEYEKPPHDGWAGYLTDEFYAFSPESLAAILHKLDFNLNEVLKSWLDEGRLKTQPSDPQKPQIKWRPPGADRSSTPRHICILCDRMD